MNTDSAEKPRTRPSARHDKAGKDAGVANVLVCVDDEQSSIGAIPHAQAIASAFGGKVVLLHVSEPPAAGSAPLDPVDWDIRRREATTRLAELARRFETPGCSIETTAREGRAVDQICACASEKPQDIVAVSRGSVAGDWHGWHTARGVVKSDVGSVLVVPNHESGTSAKTYSRVFVPLDGSSLAESAIPKAVAIAIAQKAELVICHAVPEPRIVRIGPMDNEIDDLRGKLARRNKRAGRDYLNRIKDMVAGHGLPVKAVLVFGGDIRRSLMNAVKEHSADLLVMASYGQSGHMDVPSGHVASFILAHAEIPVLMVRQQRKPGDRHFFSDVGAKGVRHPVDMMR